MMTFSTLSSRASFTHRAQLGVLSGPCFMQLLLIVSFLEFQTFL
jgi:hypothetical protein